MLPRTEIILEQTRDSILVLATRDTIVEGRATTNNHPDAHQLKKGDPGGAASQEVARSGALFSNSNRGQAYLLRQALGPDLLRVGSAHVRDFLSPESRPRTTIFCVFLQSRFFMRSKNMYLFLLEG